MYLKSSVSKYICTCVGIFFTTFTITVIVCSISLKIYFINKLRNDDDSNEGSYEDYFEAKYKATFEFVDNIIFIKKKVEHFNKVQHIYNTEKYGSVRPNTFVLVIQVHENTAFLKVLLASLKKVMGITNSLLIFCHDYYDSNINKLIQEIRFARYMQVFYPYSNQIYPKMFPGGATKFCSGDFNCTEFCTNSDECFRNPSLVQQKHFWWWHINYVFNHLNVTKHHNEMIVFLEENQYVLEDILFMLKVLGTLMPENCPQCELINFGARAAELSQYHVSNGKVIIEAWHPDLLNIGIAFNRTVWQTIRNNSYHFCYYDDYRWYASLYYLGIQRAGGPFMMLSSDAPRVLQIELCDGSTADCTLLRSIENVQRFAKSVRRGLYPRNLIIGDDDQDPEGVVPAGEWKDVRDPALCMYFGVG